MFRLAQLIVAERRYVLVIILAIFKCSVFSGFIKNIDQVQPVLGTLRCYGGNDNENVKTATLHVRLAFLYISLPSLRDYDGKMPNFTFYGGRKRATAKFSFSF